MRELLEWIDRINAMHGSPSAKPSHIRLAEQFLEDEARNFRFRVLLKATNILMEDPNFQEGRIEHEDGHVSFDINFDRGLTDRVSFTR